MNIEELREYVGNKIDEDYYSMIWADFSEDPKVKAEYQEKKIEAFKLLSRIDTLDEIARKAEAFDYTKVTLMEARDLESKKVVKYGTESEQGQEAAIKTGFYILILNLMDDAYENVENGNEQ